MTRVLRAVSTTSLVITVRSLIFSLHPFGMTGVGQIFQLFRSGKLDADDEVAMVFAEDDRRPLSEPLVNIRIALRAAEARGIIVAQERRRLVRLEKGVYFPQRSYPHLLLQARGVLPDSKRRQLEKFLATEAPDAKREDAIQLLSVIRSVIQERAEIAP